MFHCTFCGPGTRCRECVLAARLGVPRSKIGVFPSLRRLLFNTEEDYMKYLKRPGGTGLGPTGHVQVSDPDLERVAPATLEFLTVDKWDDGKGRQPGTIMVMAEGGRWKAWVHDRDGKRSSFVSSGGLLDLLREVEDMLANGSGEWRLDKR